MTDVARRVPGGASMELRPGAAQRTLDVTFCLVALVFCGPLLLLLCGPVRWTSPGPALFRQERLGRDRRSLVMLKLRTMCVGLFKLAGDPRVTRLARTPGLALDIGILISPWPALLRGDAR